MERDRSPYNPESRPQFDRTPELNWPALLEEALTAPGRMTDTYNRFYQYSFQNQILLLSQGVYEPVATYNRWQDMGRQVKKGSRAKSILRPVMHKTTNDSGEEERKIKGFKMVRCLFGVSETEGEPLPPFEPLDWDPGTAIARLGIEMRDFELMDGNTQGYSEGRTVHVSKVAKYPAKTLVHEMAHVQLGHTSEAEADDYQTHRGIKEFEAETTAYLLMHEIGADQHMDPAESRAYIQSWLRGQKPDEASIKRVFRTVDQIVKAGRRES